MAKDIVQFEIHPALIRQLIENQAGTLAKATLEGVMNGIDSMLGREASEPPLVSVTLAYDRLVIRDNGRGFKTQEEVMTAFKTFGLPQSEEKRYGRFRIGRGQLFAQGVTTYKSGPHRMVVDYRSMAEDKIGFEFFEGEDHGSGTIVEVEFYDDKIPRAGEFRQITDEIRRAVRYVAGVEILLDGERLNVDPATLNWTLEDDVAYYQLTARGAGIDVYTDGVYVENVGSYEWGATGVVVTKQALSVNQARNQVVRSSAQWRHIQNTCRDWATTRVQDRKNTSLRAHEVHAFLLGLARHPLVPPLPVNSSVEARLRWREETQAHNAAWGDVGSLKIWRDVSGKLLSWNIIKRLGSGSSTVIKSACGRTPVAFAPVGQVQAVNVYKAQRGVVLDESLLGIFGVPAEEFLCKVWASLDQQVARRFVVRPVEALESEEDGLPRALAEKDYTQKERRMTLALQHVANHVQYWLSRRAGESYPHQKARHIMVGTGSALWWTDGDSMIGVHRDVLEPLGRIHPGVMTRLTLHVFEQYCFARSNAEDQVYEQEQLELYQEMSLELGELGYDAWQLYLKALDREGKKIPADQWRVLQQLKDAGEIESAMDLDLMAFAGATPVVEETTGAVTHGQN